MHPLRFSYCMMTSPRTDPAEANWCWRRLRADHLSFVDEISSASPKCGEWSSCPALVVCLLGIPTEEMGRSIKRPQELAGEPLLLLVK